MNYKYQKIITEISDDEAQEMIEKVARFIVTRHLAPAGILAIESLHPLHSLGSQALYFIMPFAEVIFDSARYQKFALMIQKDENIRALVKRIDELDEELNRERRAEAKLRKKRRKAKLKAFMDKLRKKNIKS